MSPAFQRGTQGWGAGETCLKSHDGGDRGLEIAGLWSWAGEAEGGLVPLSLCSPSGWVLNWLKKGVEKVVPQPVRGGLEGPAQVLQGLGAGGRWGKGWWEVSTWVFCPCLSVCLSLSAGRGRDSRALQSWGLRYVQEAGWIYRGRAEEGRGFELGCLGGSGRPLAAHHFSFFGRWTQ